MSHNEMLGAVVVEYIYDINANELHLLLQLLNGDRMRVIANTWVPERVDNG